MRTSTPYTSFEAIRKANKEGKLPRMGAQSLDHTSNVVVKIVGNILGLDFLVIPGYPGTPQILLDIERGALDGRAFSTGSFFATRREWLKTGYIKPLVTSGKERDKRLPGRAEHRRDRACRQQRFALGPLLVAGFIALDGSAAGHAAGPSEGFARRFRRMTKDEMFLKEADKMGLEISLIRGEDMNRNIEATVRDKRLMDLYRMIASAK